MDVKRLAEPLGAIVSGIDVRDIDRSSFQQLNELFCEHHVLVFRDQILTPDEQIKFAEYWGDLVAHPYAAMKDYPSLIVL